MITYTFANSFDLNEISQLLQNSGLPYADIAESHVKFIVANQKERIIGCIGIEKYNSHGLLRSFAVESSLQKQGLGAMLYTKMLQYSTEHGIESIHFLTNTAREYFIKKNFTVQSRNNAPYVILNTTEFRSLCPLSSTYMVKQVS